jgi:nicotinamidase/pyrazinamidase
MTFVFGAGLACLLVILWLGYGIFRIGAVSRGVPIEGRTGTALLLIDLQSVFWDGDIYSTDQKRSAEAAIRQEVEAARAKGHPIIAVRQEWSIPSTVAVARLMMKGQAIKGSAGTKLAKPFAALADHVLVKRVQDSFETGALDALLAQLGVGTLRIVGLDLNYCVLKTALAAKARGYDVTVVSAATLSTSPTDAAHQSMVSQGVAIG